MLTCVCVCIDKSVYIHFDVSGYMSFIVVCVIISVMCINELHVCINMLPCEFFMLVMCINVLLCVCLDVYLYVCTQLNRCHQAGLHLHEQLEDLFRRAGLRSHKLAKVGLYNNGTNKNTALWLWVIGKYSILYAMLRPHD